MANCDLCNKTLSADDQYRISSRRMQEAVQDGFNPYKSSSGIKMPRIGSMFGIADDNMYREWADRVLSDPTDWILCLECHTAFTILGPKARSKSIFDR